MLRTRGGFNTSGKDTKGKKKAVETSGDPCRDNVPPVVEVEAQNMKGANVKGERKRTTEPSTFYENVVDSVVGVDNPKGDDVNVSSVDDTVTDAIERSNAEDLVETITPSVGDTTMVHTKGMESVEIPSVSCWN
ncbi:hypothetical protein LIER_19283 [Lithospermum erythrorhizon]|uniref:Uncharacterized protein n=1 Tax=Lithospermum erythrorhizon TaxID=34254 RepID=A0AAV3QMS0_LITER